MGFLFGRKGRNETHGRRGDVAKKSASVLAAVAVAGGSVAVGVPEAEALTVLPFFYLEKKNEDGDFIGGSKWRITVDEWHEYPGFDDELSRYSRLCYSVPLSYVVEDNKSLEDLGDDVVYQKASEFLSPDAYAEFEERGMMDDCIIEDSNWSDEDPDGGKILVNDLFHGLAKRITITEIESPEGYGPGSESSPSVTFEMNPVVTYDSENRQWVYHPEPEDGMGVNVVSSSGLYEPVVGKYRFGDDYYRQQHHKPEYEGVFPDGSKVSGGWVYPVGKFTNVRIPDLATVTETVAETPNPSTATVIPTSEKVTETVEVLGEGTTVVKTEPEEPTTVSEAVTETPDQPAPDAVDQPTPSAPVADTPVTTGSLSGTVVWDEGRSKRVEDGYERIPGLVEEGGDATAAVAGEEYADNDSVSAHDSAAPAPVEEGDEEKATPVETVRMALASTGASSYTLAGLGAVLAALVALAAVGRRKATSQ